MSKSKIKRPQSAEKWAEVETKYPVKGYHYEISNFGNFDKVFKDGSRLRMKGSKNQYGNTVFNIRPLYKGKKRSQTFQLRRLVAQNFLRKPAQGKIFVIHINGKTEDCYYKNLKWVTQKELSEYQAGLGLFHKKNRGATKLTATKVALIKKRLRQGKTKHKIIARDFDISLPHLRRIEKGQHWAHIE